LLKTNYIGTNP